MKVTLKQAFQLIDGRLSTGMQDVYDMLGFIFSADIMTHQIPEVMNRLKRIYPHWYSEGRVLLNEIERKVGSDNFNDMMDIIEKEYADYTLNIEKINQKEKK